MKVGYCLISAGSPFSTAAPTFFFHTYWKNKLTLNKSYSLISLFRVIFATEQTALIMIKAMTKLVLIYVNAWFIGLFLYGSHGLVVIQ